MVDPFFVRVQQRISAFMDEVRLSLMLDVEPNLMMEDEVRLTRMLEAESNLTIDELQIFFIRTELNSEGEYKKRREKNGEVGL